MPPGYEFGLKIYYSGDGGKTWAPLINQQISQGDNLVVARMAGSGLYALATSVDIPFNRGGWQVFSYPLPVTRTLTEALQSIQGNYSTVYAYDSTDKVNPSRVYDKALPLWVNDLTSWRPAGYTGFA